MFLSVYFKRLLEGVYLDSDLVGELYLSLNKIKEIAGVKVFVQDARGIASLLSEDGNIGYPNFPKSGIICNVKPMGNNINNLIPLPRECINDIRDSVYHFLKCLGVDSCVITFEYLGDGYKGDS